VEETDTTRGPENSSLEGSSQPLPAADRPAPASPSFVYALGRIEPRFPSLAVEKEFVQVTGRADAAGLTDREALQTVLSDRANRYLARQLCWVFVIEGLETYLLALRDPADLELLVEAVRPRPNPIDVDVVIGMRGPLAPPEACNGLVVPIVVFDQIYSFDRDALLGAIPRPKGVPAKEDERFRASAAEVLDRILQMADNAGATDEHRALNYLAVRYPAIYAQTTEAHASNASLAAVDVRPSRLSGVRRIVDVIFSYRNRQTDVTEKYFVRVDVTEEFPFLVTKLSPYYER
jgi:cyclic patellamide precursor peptide PatG